MGTFDEELWSRPRVKAAVARDGVKLMEAITICRQTGGLSNASQPEIEAILCGKVDAWKIYSAKPKDGGHVQLSLIGRTVGQRWFRRGDFGVGPSYNRAEIEIEVAEAGLVTWNAVITETMTEGNQSSHGGQKTSKHGGTLPWAAAIAPV